ncbi:hypothetical protein ACFE04_019180 [Oxalis oulophora]
MTTSQSPPYDIIIIKAAGANSVWFIRNGVVVVQGMRLGGAVICILESTKLRFEEMEAQLINRSFNVGLRPNSKLPNVILQSTSKANVEEPPELVFLLEQESEVYHFTPTEKLKRPPVAFPKNRDSGLFPITKSFNVQIGFGANIRDKTITWKGKFSSPKDMHSGADNVSLILAITRDVDLTEKLHYSSAVALPGGSLILAITRCFSVRTEATRVMATAPLLGFITTHILYLNIYKLDYGFTQLFGDDNLLLHKDGKLVHLTLNERTCSGFVSQDLYFHGFFSASIKLPADYTAAVGVAFYMSNGDMFEKNHDEIDFEFLVNIRGKDWRIQTNIYGNGSTVGV